MKTLPAAVSAYKRTTEFTEDTIPKGILNAHQTKAGTWGKIVVLEGELLYSIYEPELEKVILSPAQHGVVEPTIQHDVKPLGSVRFYVEFYR